MKIKLNIKNWIERYLIYHISINILIFLIFLYSIDPDVVAHNFFCRIQNDNTLMIKSLLFGPLKLIPEIFEVIVRLILFLVTFGNYEW